MANSTNGPVADSDIENAGSNEPLPKSETPEGSDNYASTWGFNLQQLYKMATTFLKEHEGKAFHTSYDDKLLLVAYTLQVAHGKYDEEKCPPLGYLDVIGRDRRQAWISLGNVDKETAMKQFIELLNQRCPLFRPFVEAHKRHMEENERRRKEEEERKKREEEEEKERQRLEEEQARIEQEKAKQLEQKRLIQEALNRQTYHQFKAYAEQQFPGNPEQQAVLIRQLQEQHYHQYMQQVLNQQKTGNNTQQQHPAMADTEEKKDTNSQTPTVNGDGETAGRKGDSSPEEESAEEDAHELPAIPTASMWTRKDIKEFKECIRKEGGDGIIKVGHGETVTVRVPTHVDGTCLFWEFATDSYDLGFGVYFDWTPNPGSQVSVHISESEDEEEDEEEERSGGSGDVESGAQPKGDATRPPPLSVVIPVYRRDCHEEVYAGSHLYPGQGAYLLKFDNSYSLWRSKTLYYRVYYTR
ncbi:Golgi resident protein GCP60-like [Ornithodoros turicata]|uniref:Protein involved in maintenance of golgi structure and er-golgi transport n=1 Tax=Ornithodoros turicata TaxID=34597 RepID=A0A2R5LEU2_9ACAR